MEQYQLDSRVRVRGRSHRVGVAVMAVLALALVALSPVSRPASPAQAAPATVYSEGTFIQPWATKEWTLSDWVDVLQEMKDLKNDLVIIAPTAEGNDTTGIKTIYPTSIPGMSKDPTYRYDTVDLALKAAEQVDVQIWLGLFYNSEFYNTPKTGTAGAAWLATQYDRSEAVLTELWDSYSSYSSLTGFYDVYELENLGYQELGTGTTQNAMKTEYAGLADAVHSYTGTTLAVAPYIYKSHPGTAQEFVNTATGARQDLATNMAAWKATWTDILGAADIDYFMPQDSIGTGQLNLTEALAWLDVHKEVTDSTNTKSVVTHLWSDAETFLVNDHWDPMPIGTLVQNLIAEAPKAEKLITFSQWHYQSAANGHALYSKTYADYLATGVVETSPPSTPTGLAATKTTANMVQLSWNASSDDTGAMYLVYRDGQRVARVLDDEWQDAGPLTPGTSYTYTVRAFDAAGNQSGLSSSLAVTTRAASTVLSTGKPYTASPAAHASYPDTGGAELTDGVLASGGYADPAWNGRWAAGDVPVDATFTVDLGSLQRVDEVALRTLKDDVTGVALPRSVKVSLSADGTNYTELGDARIPQAVSIPNGNALRYGLIAPDGTTARYVRVTTSSSPLTWTFLDELQVLQSPVNLAAGKTYTSSLAASGSYPDAGGELTDGVLGTGDYWDGAWQGRTATSYSFTLDLGASTAFSQLALGFLRADGPGIAPPTGVAYSVSADGVSYSTPVSVTPSAPANTSRGQAVHTYSAPVNARYVRVTVSSTGGWSFLDELRVIR